jgi:hypothetical protein
VRHGAGVLGVFGDFIALGRPVGHSWVSLAEAAAAGSKIVVVDAVVDWPAGSEVVIPATDFDPHEAEVRVIGATFPAPGDGSKTVLNLTVPLLFQHYGAAAEQYHNRQIQMRGRVGLLTRNIVIKGGDQGEDTPYTLWNSPSPSPPAGGSLCGNDACDPGEDSRGCPADCRGPAFEYGAAVLVSAYTDDSAVCGRDGGCTTGFRRAFSGSINASNVEMRYFGQNSLQAGLTLAELGDKGQRCSIADWSFNRGYFGAVAVQGTSGARIGGAVVFRSMLPAVWVKGGERPTSNNTVEGVLSAVGIFWNTHRGAAQVEITPILRVSASLI